MAPTLCTGHGHSLVRQPGRAVRRCVPIRCFGTRAATSVAVIASAVPPATPSRRSMLHSFAGAALGTLLQQWPAAAAGVKEVGSYLPPAGVEDFVLFVPASSKTPVRGARDNAQHAWVMGVAKALRAGTVDNTEPYKFALPPSFSEAKVSNTQSGNYCQPRCDEPWTEVIFANDKDGRVELIVSPLQKLTPRKNVKIEDLGTPEQLLARVGNFITGTYLDEEDVVSSTSQANPDGLTYYYYEINAPYGKVGPHTVTACTVKGDLAFLFVVSATDRQWAKNEARLKKVVQSFKA